MLCNNLIINNGLLVFTQVIFIFSFLVIFYFLYVVNIEQQDFKEQIEFIVDSLFNDIKDNIKDIVDFNASKLNEDDIQLISYGIIDVLEEKYNIQQKEAIKAITEKNNKIKNNCYKIIGILLIIVIITFIILSCSPVFAIIKESIITVIFIAFTELIFLTFISSKYISADPNKIKKQLGTTVKNWIKNNKKI